MGFIAAPATVTSSIYYSINFQISLSCNFVYRVSESDFFALIYSQKQFVFYNKGVKKNKLLIENLSLEVERYVHTFINSNGHIVCLNCFWYLSVHP